MNGFKFGARSLVILGTVQPVVWDLCHTALGNSELDFGVTSGKRTQEEQDEHVRDGRSQTRFSYHLTGFAVDILVYVNGKATWERRHYATVAEAFRQASFKLEDKYSVRWGGAWQVPSLKHYEGTTEDATQTYIAGKVAEGERPFVDAVHFEVKEHAILASEA